MKKVALILVLVLAAVLTCSCVEKIDAETPDILGPMDAETQPNADKPIGVIDTDNLPENGYIDTPNPSDPTDVNTPDKPVTPVGEIVFESMDTAVTTPLSGYIHNDSYSAKGDVIEKYTSGNTEIYKVCYGRTITFVVEITQTDSLMKIETFIEHYKFHMGNEKTITLSVGELSATTSLPELEWEDNVSAKTKISSATVAPPEGTTVNVDIKIPFGGKYHGETIDNLVFSKDITIK